jgi:Uncharacterized conserved domain (SAYSvFN)
MWQLWLILWLVCGYYVKFDALFIIATVFLLIFTNLGNRKIGQFSAYNVFNRGYQHLLGDLRGERIEQDMRQRDISDIKSDRVNVKHRLDALKGQYADLEKIKSRYIIG